MYSYGGVDAFRLANKKVENKKQEQVKIKNLNYSVSSEKKNK